MGHSKPFYPTHFRKYVYNKPFYPDKIYYKFITCTCKQIVPVNKRGQISGHKYKMLYSHFFKHFLRRRPEF